MLLPGCSSLVASYLPFPLSLVAGGSVRCGSCDSGSSYQYDDSTARNQWEADAQMDSWLNQQAVQQQNDMANQMTNDATAAAANAAAASAAVGIGTP